MNRRGYRISYTNEAWQSALGTYQDTFFDNAPGVSADVLWLTRHSEAANGLSLMEGMDDELVTEKSVRTSIFLSNFIISRRKTINFAPQGGAGASNRLISSD